jgi:hypothetical protein
MAVDEAVKVPTVGSQPFHRKAGGVVACRVSHGFATANDLAEVPVASDFAAQSAVLRREISCPQQHGTCCWFTARDAMRKRAATGRQAICGHQ